MWQLSTDGLYVLQLPTRHIVEGLQKKSYKTTEDQKKNVKTPEAPDKECSTCGKNHKQYIPCGPANKYLNIAELQRSREILCLIM